MDEAEEKTSSLVRHQIERDDPNLVRLEIGHYLDRGGNRYCPRYSSDYEQIGRAIGRNSHLKELMVSLPRDWSEKVFTGTAQNRSIKKLVLDGTLRRLHERELSMLVPFFAGNPNLEHLGINHFYLDYRSCQVLSSALSRFNSLRAFNLESCRIRNRLGGSDVESTRGIVCALAGHDKLQSIGMQAAGYAALAPLLRSANHPHLVELDLTTEELFGREEHINGEVVIDLGDALAQKSTITKLSLRYFNGISVVGWRAMLSTLQNPRSSLATLSLEGSSINDDAALVLTKGLTNNDSLRELDLSGVRYMTLEGWKAIFAVLLARQGRTLEKLVISNTLPHGEALVGLAKILNLHFVVGNDAENCVETDLKVLPCVIAWMAKEGVSNSAGNRVGGISLLYQFVRSRSGVLFE